MFGRLRNISRPGRAGRRAVCPVIFVQHVTPATRFPMLQKSSTAALRALPAIAVSLLASTAGAEEYRWQISGGYGETQLATFADLEREMLDATYYIDPVDDARGPYFLAPFLSRSSRVTAGVTSDKTTITLPV